MDAVYLGEFSIAEQAQITAQDIGESVTSSEQRYITSAEIIVATIYSHYNADRNLIDVRVNEIRFPRSDISVQ